MGEHVLPSFNISDNRTYLENFNPYITENQILAIPAFILRWISVVFYVDFLWKLCLRDARKALGQFGIWYISISITDIFYNITSTVNDVLLVVSPRMTLEHKQLLAIYTCLIRFPPFLSIYLHILYLAIFRFLAIYNPIKYKTFSSKSIYRSILSIWIFSSAISIWVYMGPRMYFDWRFQMINRINQGSDASLMVFASIFTFSSLISLSLYCSIACLIRKHKASVSTTSTTNHSSNPNNTGVKTVQGNFITNPMSNHEKNALRTGFYLAGSATIVEVFRSSIPFLTSPPIMILRPILLASFEILLCGGNPILLRLISKPIREAAPFPKPFKCMF